jgi:Apea-like HEPN
MHPEASKACRRAIRAGLAHVRFEAGKTYPGLGVSEYLDKVRAFALKDPVLKRCLRTPEVFYIAYTSMSRVFRARMKLPTAAAGSLSDYIGDEGLQEIEDLSMRILDSIPRKCIGYFSMPEAEGLGMASCELMKGIRFFDASAAQDAPPFLRQPIVPPSEPSALSGLLSMATKASEGALAAAAKPGPPRYYLAIHGEGFSNGSLSNPTVQFMVARMKQIVALGESVQGLGVTLGALVAGGQNSKLLVHDLAEEGAEEVALPEALARHLSGIGFQSHRWVSDKPRAAGLAASILDTPPSAEEAFARLFTPVRSCIARDVRDVLTAAEWAFDASAETNQTLSYLYTAIGLEAVLGSSADRVMESLADRLSYLIGDTRADREQLQAKFIDFYRHRSKIVHGRTAQLGERESELLGWGKSVLSRAIGKELTLLGRGQ